MKPDSIETEQLPMVSGAGYFPPEKNNRPHAFEFEAVLKCKITLRTNIKIHEEARQWALNHILDLKNGKWSDIDDIFDEHKVIELKEIIRKDV